MKHGILAISVFVCTAVSFNATAGALPKVKKLNVIEDRGGISTDYYYSEYLDYQPQKAEKIDFSEHWPTSFRTTEFPVVSEKLSVGQVTEQEIDQVQYKYASNPMFIVGDDPVSIQWLLDNKDMLAANKAIGLVVNVESRQSLRELHQLVDRKVVLQPVMGDSLSDELGISHYPFYVDHKGVMR